MPPEKLSYITAHPLFNAVQEGLLLALVVSAPVLIAAAVASLVIGLFQSATRLHDETISTVPRLIAIYAVIAVGGLGALSQLVLFGERIVGMLPGIQR